MAEPEREIKEDKLAHVPPNLRPFLFPKGVSGNPGGRPKDTPITVSQLLKRVMKEGGVDLAVSSAVTVLANPNHKHWFATWREIMDRTEGKVADRIHHELKRFEEGIELKDGRRASGPVPLPKVLELPPVQPPVQPEFDLPAPASADELARAAPRFNEEGPAPPKRDEP